VLLIGAGYVGAYLAQRLRQDGVALQVCDRQDLPGVDLPLDYDQLSATQLAPFSHVLWFAGHASVAQSVADPLGAARNNCTHLFELAQRLAAHTHFIYASSASLYSSDAMAPRHAVESDLIHPGSNAYDTSKFAFDYLAKGFLRGFTGLRMGTLCGFSPRMRPELIFNQMNITALRDQAVRVANPERHRSILFLSDLYAAVRACVALPQAVNGFINLASLNLTIGDIAQRIADHHRVPVQTMPDSPTYSFTMDTQRAQQSCKCASTTT
jgi:nucleoside-diphosphate-sugar epimerase